jgi:hypothetical protein
LNCFFSRPPTSDARTAGGPRAALRAEGPGPVSAERQEARVARGQAVVVEHETEDRSGEEYGRAKEVLDKMEKVKRLKKMADAKRKLPPR